MHILPLLCDVLLRTFELRHLCVNVVDNSSPVFLTLLKCRSLFRTSISPAASTFNCVKFEPKYLTSTFSLPRLVSFHTSCFHILGMFSCNCLFKAAALTEIIGQMETISVLEDLTKSGSYNIMKAFTCFYNVLGSVKGQVWVISTTFPNLTYFRTAVPMYLPLFCKESYAAFSVSFQSVDVYQQLML